MMREAHANWCQLPADHGGDCGVLTASFVVVGPQSQTWRCPDCGDTTALDGLCPRCGVFGLRIADDAGHNSRRALVWIQEREERRKDAAALRERKG